MARLPIPEAMAWKYGAKCSKSSDGQSIDRWEHPTIPKPNSAQVLIDVQDYNNYINSGQKTEDEKNEKFNKDIVKALGLTMKDYLNELRSIAGLPDLTNAEIKEKFTSYL